jgi:two-component sensor histidine kinase
LNTSFYNFQYFILRYSCFVLCLLTWSSNLKSQLDSNLVLTFNFNHQRFNEQNDKLIAKGSGVSFVEDRFGNEASAIFINGHVNSYLNLGTSSLLKPKALTLSLWVNLSRRVYAGKGYESNQIVMTKNGPQDDFYSAYSIHYDGYNNRFGVACTKDSTSEALVFSKEEAQFGKWYNFIITLDNNHLSFYLNGKLQGKSKKNFETIYMPSDSVVFGHTANKKNERFSMGVFDDIQIFHRVLSEKEILELYQAPNPNRNKLILMAVLKWVLLISTVIVLAFALVWRRRRMLKIAKDKLDVKRKLHEMEIRTLKAQMNPHFIFNSLNSIQQFIMLKENDKAELYLSKFSKLIRELLESNTNENLTVVEEIEILKGYLEMEALRFGSTFHFTIDVDDRIDCKLNRIPHMMIQPFVENAIWHGLLPKTGEKNLTIKFISNSNKTITCHVEDNGIGREESKKKTSTFKKKSLALSFVEQRLRLIKESMNFDCSVEIIDLKNEFGENLGTKVVVILPVLNS